VFKKLLVPVNMVTSCERVLSVVNELLQGGAEEATLFIVAKAPKATPQRRRGLRRQRPLAALPGAFPEGVLPAAPPSYAETKDQAIERRDHELLEYLDEVGRPLLETGRPVHAAVHFGQPAREIINFARKGQFDLIIMAAHGRSSVIAEVIRSGVAMVLALPPALVSQRDKQNGSSL
jgi:nucleotide-binding universal stress UspA family protein